jgi:hypothetical protein
MRKHFNVPGKIPFNTRMTQLASRGFGAFSKVEGSNTLTLDLEAIKSGKAVVKEKAPKLKVEKKSKEKISTQVSLFLSLS